MFNESHNITSPDGIAYRLPFQNICYRSLVRVVDFFPPKLEDFSVPINAEYAALSDSEGEHDMDEPNNQLNVTWEWRFCLLVESHEQPPQGQARERLKLFVSKYDAEHLLKLTAEDFVLFFFFFFFFLASI